MHYRQAKMLVNVSLITTIISFSYLVISLILEIDKGVYMMLFDVIGFLIIALLVRTTINIHILSNVYTAIGSFAVYYLIYYSGGISSPILIWTIAGPIIALLITNRITAITWAFFMVIAVLILGFLDIFHLTPASELPGNYRIYLITSILFGLTFIIFMVTLIFEQNMKNALSLSDQKNDALVSALEQVKESQLNLRAINEQMTAKNIALQASQGEIIRQADQLKVLNEEKDYIIEVLSHDLKEPLNSVQGLVNLILRDENKLSAHQAECIDHIRKTVATSHALLSKILQKGEADNFLIGINAVACHLQYELRQVINSFSVKADKKNIRIQLNAPAQEIQITTDAILLRQIIENIISNSIKYSPSNTTVNIDVEKTRESVKMEFKDEGPGISEKDLPKLFDKYTRLSAKPTAGESSSGLGLSLVKRYVESLNGKIWYEHTKNHGSNFIVLLPLRYS